jgi:stage III sporulation protein AD
MSDFIKIIAGIFTAIILWICLSKENKATSVLLSLAVCSAALTVGLTFLQPVINFLNNIRLLGNINEDLLKIMMKVVGIGVLAEFSSLICKDAGNEAMGKSVQIVSIILILRMSIPVFEILITLLDDILGSI